MCVSAHEHIACRVFLQSIDRYFRFSMWHVSITRVADRFSLVSRHKRMDSLRPNCSQTVPDRPGIIRPSIMVCVKHRSNHDLILFGSFILGFLQFCIWCDCAMMDNAVRCVAMCLVHSGQISRNDFFHWGQCLWYWRTDDEKIYKLHLNLLEAGTRCVHDTGFSEVDLKWLYSVNRFATGWWPKSAMYDTAAKKPYFLLSEAQCHLSKVFCSRSSKTTTNLESTKYPHTVRLFHMNSWCKPNDNRKYIVPDDSRNLNWIRNSQAPLWPWSCLGN